MDARQYHSPSCGMSGRSPHSLHPCAAWFGPRWHHGYTDSYRSRDCAHHRGRLVYSPSDAGHLDQASCSWQLAPAGSSAYLLLLLIR